MGAFTKLTLHPLGTIESKQEGETIVLDELNRIGKLIMKQCGDWFYVHYFNCDTFVTLLWMVTGISDKLSVQEITPTKLSGAS